MLGFLLSTIPALLLSGGSTERTQSVCVLGISSSPVMTIGDGSAPGDELFGVGVAHLLNDGRTIVLANRGTSQLRFYTRSGQFIRAVGGRGAGPGEYRALSGPWHVGDSLLVSYDALLRRFTTVGLDGSLITTAPLLFDQGVRWPSAVGSIGTDMVAINGQAFERGEMGVGYVRPPFVFLRYARTGQLVDTLHRLPGREFFVPPNRRLEGTVALPFGVNLLYGFAGQDMYYLDTEGSRLMKVRARERPRLVADLQIARARISAADRELYLREQLQQARTPAQRSAAEALERVPFPKQFPTFDRMFVTRQHQVWLREYARTDDMPTQWQIVDGNEGTVCRLTLPARTSPLAVDSTGVLLLARSEDGEEFVQLHRLLPGRSNSRR